MIITLPLALLTTWAAVSAIYVAVFTAAARFGHACTPSRARLHTETSTPLHATSTPAQITSTPLHADRSADLRICVVIPAYAEDAVIECTVRALLRQMDNGRHAVVVVSDHMTNDTNALLEALPITLLKATYSPSSKAKALQLAMRHLPIPATHIAVLDADNLVMPGFIDALCRAIADGGDSTVLQCHRCARNLDTPVARLDAVSEEINNTVFRLGHNALRLSAALIGSGMCFPAEWFASHVARLSTSGEDKELEAMLLSEGLYVRYLADVPVYDHKVQTSGSFSGQRRRWLAAQLATLCHMMPRVPSALRHGRYAYADKCLQQALMPRSVLVMLCLVMSLLTPWAACTVPFAPWWWALTALLCVALLAAVPRRLCTRCLVIDLMHAPLLATIMVAGMFRLRGQNKTFSHTKHN